jgi:hypothetical protein
MIEAHQILFKNVYLLPALLRVLTVPEVPITFISLASIANVSQFFRRQQRNVLQPSRQWGNRFEASFLVEGHPTTSPHIPPPCTIPHDRDLPG